MPLTLEQLESEALRLPKDARAHLAEALITSLDEEAEVERAWEREIERRYEELRSGEVEPVPADQVFSELDDLIK